MVDILNKRCKEEANYIERIY